MRKKLISMLLLLFAQLLVFAQNNEPVAMADTMRSNGKIYVVVAVLLTVLTGLFIYLWRLDKKVSKLEKGIIEE